MSMKKATLDLWVGIFVALGLAALLFLALRVGSTSGFETKETYNVKAAFDNIGGLKVRAPVKSAGVVVGRVSDIEFDTTRYEAIVTLNLSAQYKFPTDTSAAIMTSGLLGEQYVSLEAGGDEKMLANGGEIKIVQGAVVLENLISQFIHGGAGKDDAAPAAGPAAE